MEKVISSIQNFKPLEHRLELVGTYNEITYYKIIDEETCIIYLINGENIEYLSADLVYWPITDVLKTRGL